jgi:hypothetical protein
LRLKNEGFLGALILVAVVLIISGSGEAFHMIEEELIRRANEGDADAQYKLARIYVVGKEVPRDLKLSSEWMLRAADNGHPEACVSIGSGLATKRDKSPEDIQKAIQYFHRAKDKGSLDAEHWLASELDTTNPHPSPEMAKKIFGYYESAAAKGHLRSIETMAHIFLFKRPAGPRLAVPDPRKGFEYARSYAEKILALPHPVAELVSQGVLLYPLCLLYGKGCEKDFDKAYALLSEMATRLFYFPMYLLANRVVPPTTIQPYIVDLEKRDVNDRMDISPILDRLDADENSALKPGKIQDFETQKLIALVREKRPAANIDYLTYCLKKADRAAGSV